MNTQDIKKIIRDVPDFPKKGIIFKDITPVLKDPAAFGAVLDAMAEALKPARPSVIVGIESRGFIFGAALAAKLKIGFVPVRKKGKLPWKTERISCTLEYGEDVLEIHQDAVEKGARVALVDDLLATGGTAFATAQLIGRLGGEVVKMAFLIELAFLEGRKKLSPYDVFSLISY